MSRVFTQEVMTNCPLNHEADFSSREELLLAHEEWKRVCENDYPEEYPIWNKKIGETKIPRKGDAGYCAKTDDFMKHMGGRTELGCCVVQVGEWNCAMYDVPAGSVPAWLLPSSHYSGRRINDNGEDVIRRYGPWQRAFQ